jgi:hypothetical protein
MGGGCFLASLALMPTPEIKSLLLKCLETRVIPPDLSSGQLHVLNYAYAKMIHCIMHVLDECISKRPSALLDVLAAQAEEMLDQPPDATFRVAHALLISGPYTIQRFQLEPLTILAKFCCLKPHALPKTGVYFDLINPVPSWWDMIWASFEAATPEVRKGRYGSLHCHRIESHLMALHDKTRTLSTS